MVFQRFSIQIAGRLKQIQDTINDHIGFYEEQCQLGGHVIETSKDDYKDQTMISMRTCQETHDSTQYRTEYRKLTTLSRKDAHLDNYLTFSQRLQNSATWKNIKNDSNQTLIARLEINWMRQAAHSYFTIDALFEVDALLQSLLGFTEDALEEISTNKYQANIITYKNYLINLEQDIIKEWEAIAEALFYRLKLTFETHSLVNYHPLRAILDNFNQLGINDFDIMRENFEIIRHEKPFPMAKAYSYLMTNGAKDLKAVTTPYFLLKGATRGITIHPFQQDDKHYLIPETLLGLIPAKWSFWMWFVPGYKARYTFIQNKSDVLFQLLDAQHSHIPQNAILDLNHPFWLRLNNLQHKLDGELSQTEQKKHRRFSFLFKKTNELFFRWNTLVFQQQHALVKKQMDYLEVMANNMASPLNLLLGEQNENYLIEEVTHDSIQLKAQLNLIEKRLDDMRFSKAERQRFQRIKDKIISRWEEGEGLNTQDDQELTLTSKLHQLAESNQLSSLSSIFALCKDLQFLKTHDEPSLEHFAIHQAHYFKTILANMVKQLAGLAEKIKSEQTLSIEHYYFIATSKLLSFVLPYAEDMELPLQTLGQRLQIFLKGYPEYIISLSQKQALANKENLESINTAIYTVASLNPNWDKEAQTLSKASGFLRAIIAGREPRSTADLIEKSKRIRATLSSREFLGRASPESHLRGEERKPSMQGRMFTHGAHDEKNQPDDPTETPMNR